MIQNCKQTCHSTHRDQSRHVSGENNHLESITHLANWQSISNHGRRWVIRNATLAATSNKTTVKLLLIRLIEVNATYYNKERCPIVIFVKRFISYAVWICICILYDFSLKWKRQYVFFLVEKDQPIWDMGTRASLRLHTPAHQLFVQQYIQANNKEHMQRSRPTLR